MHSRPCRIPLFLLAWLLAGPVLAQPYTFQLPSPTTAPVSKVRVMLDLDAAPGPGAAINFAGTTVTVGNVEPLGAPNVGDFVVVTAVPGTNSLLIELSANSILAPLPAPGSGVDYCAVKAGVVPEKSYSFTPVGLPTITGYRITGYRASPATCGKCANRRVDTVTWVAGQEPPGANRGRLPLDIALVLDRSGSMSSPTPGDMGPMAGSKWSALQRSIDQFVGVWQVEGLGAGTTGGTGLAKDRLALIYFESASQVVPLAGGPFIERGSGTGTHPWEAIKVRVNGDGPLGATALGSGLKDAITTWRGLPVAGKLDLAVVLMTDGMQNVSPLVNKRADGRRVLDLGDGTGEQSLGDLCIPVLAVSVGVPGAMTPHGELLTEIASQTAGNPLLATSSTLASSFLTQLVAALKGNTLATLAQKQEVIPASVSLRSTPVEVDPTARSIIVALSTRPGRSTPLSVRVRLPGGTMAQPSAQVRGRNTVVQRFEVDNKLGPPGTWTFDVVRNPDFPGDQPYELSVLAEERSLDFGLHIPGERHPAGKPLTLNAEVIFDGKPLSKEQELELRVIVERPQAGLGTLLHTTKLPPPQIPGTPPPGGGVITQTPGSTVTTQPGTTVPAPSSPTMAMQQRPDSPSAYQQKLEALALDSEFRKKLESLKGEQVAMKRLENGRFTLDFDDTKTPGTYRFHVVLEGKSADGIPLRRIESVETAVEVVPHGPSSALASAPSPDGSADAYVLTLVPRDALGNFKGPGYEDQLRVTLGAGKVVSVGTPQVDGTYQVLVTGVQKDTPVEISMGADPIARGTVTKLEPVEPAPTPEPEPKPRPKPRPKPGPCGHCGAAGDMMLLYALPLLVLFLRRRSRRA